MIALLALLAAAQGDALRVTFVEGDARAAPTAEEAKPPRAKEAKPLRLGGRIEPGTTVVTGEGRIELTAADGSVVRLGPRARLVVDRLSGEKRRSIGLGLELGRLWAKVTRAVGGTFEVRTANAVAGVRGTAFAVLAEADRSALVQVYAGSVGVRGVTQTSVSARVRVPGPSRVSRAEWEEVVAAAMTQVKVSALGDISPAERFEDEGEALAWAEWNQARDGPAH